MPKPSVAVAIPAYNESEGIVGFLKEIDHALAPHAESLRLVVVDDASGDETLAALERVSGELGATLKAQQRGAPGAEPHGVCRCLACSGVRDAKGTVV